jgi:hypothetical protein
MLIFISITKHDQRQQLIAFLDSRATTVDGERPTAGTMKIREANMKEERKDPMDI